MNSTQWYVTRPEATHLVSFDEISFESNFGTARTRRSNPVIEVSVRAGDESVATERVECLEYRWTREGRLYVLPLHQPMLRTWTECEEPK